MSIKRIAGVLRIQNDFTATPQSFWRWISHFVQQHTCFSFLSANAFVRFLSYFFSFFLISMYWVAIFRAVCESQNPCSHTHAMPCHTFSFSLTSMYVCNSYSCGCATVFGIHQRIYRTNDGITYNFDFSATNPLVMSNRWVKNLCDNSFTHTHTHAW